MVAAEPYFPRSPEPTGDAEPAPGRCKKFLTQPERNRRLEIVTSSAATLKEVKA
jgi:hypothetical protein